VDSALALIEAVIATLKADTALAALVGDRVYTDVQQKAAFPYLVISVDSEAFAANDFSGQSHSLRLQAFSQKPAVTEALGIRKAALEALDRKEGDIALSGLVKCEYSGSSTMFQEDDGKTWQAIGEIEVIVV
jgi:hypothetical protein